MQVPLPVAVSGRSRTAYLEVITYVVSRLSRSSSIAMITYGVSRDGHVRRLSRRSRTSFHELVTFVVSRVELAPEKWLGYIRYCGVLGLLSFSLLTFPVFVFLFFILGCITRFRYIL